MLTYFLEGEDASQRQRRISNANFKRSSSSPDGEVLDSTADIFGAPIIDRKYWPNGTTSVATEPIEELVCESSNKAEVTANCDKCGELDPLFDKLFLANNNTCNSKSVESRDIDSPVGKIVLSDTNPFKTINQGSRNCKSEPDCVTEALLTNCDNNDIFENANTAKRGTFQRMISLPVQGPEEVTPAQYAEDMV